MYDILYICAIISDENERKISVPFYFVLAVNDNINKIIHSFTIDNNLGLAFFIEHDDGSHFVFPDHLPKVSNCVG